MLFDQIQQTSEDAKLIVVSVDWSMVKLSGVQKAFQMQNPTLVLDAATRAAITEAADPRAWGCACQRARKRPERAFSWATPEARRFQTQQPGRIRDSGRRRGRLGRR